MAAEIKPTTSMATAEGNSRKPQLLNKIEGHSDDVHMAIITPREDGVISVSDDRTVRIWLKRDTGQYWPSICHTMQAAATSLDFCNDTRRLYVGMDNGTICEYQVADDYNKMNHVRDYLAHLGRVTAVFYSLDHEWLLSCGRDKYFQWHCSQTGRRIGGYQTNAWCTCLQFDVKSCYTFVGNFSGHISVLKISNNGFEVITTLKGHSGSVRSLAWDAERRLLFSASFDQSIIVWDIGGQRGTAFELQGHHDRIHTILYTPISKQLLSAGEDNMLAFWNMDVKRKETPEWAECDTCQKCDSPFFWNVKSMWEQKTIGVRQHHCRSCGKAICDKCSQKRSTIPMMGYEYDVRVCDECHASLSDEDRSPMATFHETKQSVTFMHLDSRKGQLVTVGKDRVIKLWDISSVLH